MLSCRNMSEHILTQPQFTDEIRVCSTNYGQYLCPYLWYYPLLEIIIWKTAMYNWEFTWLIFTHMVNRLSQFEDM